MNQVGVHTGTLIASLPSPYTTVTKSVTFSITVSDPCSTTTLNPPSVLPTAMATSVLVQITPSGSPLYVTQQVGVFTDSASLLYGTGSGVNICGARQYSISFTVGSATTALSAAELTIDPSTGIISVYTSNSATIGTHSVTVKASLTGSYSSRTLSLASFTLTINPCNVTGFTMSTLSPTYDKTYTVADPALSWNLVASSLPTLTTQVPACGYTQTLSSSSLPSFVTAIPGPTLYYTASSRSEADVGVYPTPTLTSTLIGYSYSPVPTCSQTFVITALDPCLLTTVSIGPSTIQNFVEFAGYNSTSLATYTFNDSKSLALTWPSDPSDFCGDKTFKFYVNATVATQLYGQNKGNIYFSPPSNTTNFGVGLATVYVAMKNYPSIKSAPISFTATILGTVVPTIFYQVYQINSAALSIIYQPFQVLTTSYTTPTSSVNAYILSQGTKLPTIIDLTCACLTPISGLSWISLNSTTNSFLVYTTNSSLIGSYTIVLVQSFSKFSGVNPYTQFQVTIQAAVTIPIQKSPPYFQPALSTQVASQCPNQTVKLWSFTLPGQVDPNNSTVSMQVALNSSFFTFDNSSQTVNQKNFSDTPINQTIKITLQDQLNLTATYTMQVQFVCQAVNLTFNFSSKNQTQVQKQSKWPTAYISQVESGGLMHVTFNQRMKVPDHSSYVQNETISLNGTTYPILQLTILPGKYSETKMMQFNWTLVNYTTTQLLLQLQFANPDYISSHNLELDKIQLQIYGYQLFSDDHGNLMMPATILKPVFLPQMASAAALASAQSLASTAQGAMQTAMLANTVVSILISGPMQQLLQSVKQLQIMVHIMLINVAYPATSSVFFGMLMQVLTFQFYDFGNFYDRVLNLDPNGVGNNPMNNQFNTMGYSSLYIIKNFGTLCWTIFIAPMGWIFAPIVIAVCKGEFAHLKVKFNRLMFFNYWIGFVNETYLFLAVCAALNLYFLQFDTYGDTINSCLTLLFGSVLLLFPIFVGTFYNLPTSFQRILSLNEEFFARFGNAIEGLNFKRQGRTVLIHSVAAILRKLWLAHIVVFQQSQPVFSIFQINFQALIMMIISGTTEPAADRTANQMELVNEVFILLTTYHLYQFTSFMVDLQIRSYVGTSLIVITITNVMLNIFIVVFTTLALTARKLKLQYLEYKQAQRFKKQFQEKLKCAIDQERKDWNKARQDQKDRRKARLVQRKKEIAEATLLQKRLAQAAKVLIQKKQTKPSLTKQTQPVKARKQVFENQLAFGNQPSKLTSTQSQTLPSKITRKIQQRDFNEIAQVKTASEQVSIVPLVQAKVKRQTLQTPQVKQQSRRTPKVKPVPASQEEHKIMAISPGEAMSRLHFLNNQNDAAGHTVKTVKVLYSLESNKKIEVQEFYKHGQIVQLSVLVDGFDLHSFAIQRGDDRDAIEQQRKMAEYTAQELQIGISAATKHKIKTGELDRTLEEYALAKQNNQNDHNISFSKDLGEYSREINLFEKIHLYNRIKWSQTQQKL